MRKRRGLSRLLCAGMAVVMTLGLCACGDDGASNANAALAKEYVYGYEEIALPGAENADDISINSVARFDGRIYMAVNIYNWSTGDGSDQLKLFSMKEDGTDMQSVDIDFSQTEGSVTGDATGEGNEADETVDEGVEDSGIVAGDMARTAEVTVTVEEPAEDVLIDESFGVDTDMSLDEDFYSQTYENTYYNSYTIGKNGVLYALKNYYFEDYSDPENYIFKQEYSICAWDLTGKFLWQAPIDNLQTEDSYSYVNKIIPAAEGTLNILISGDRTGIIGIDANGAMTGEKTLKNGADVLAKASDVVVKEDGSLVVLYYDDEWTQMYMTSYDINTDTLGQETVMPQSVAWSGYQSITAGVDKDIIYTTGTGVYGYSVGDTEPTKMMDYVNSDINTDCINKLIVLDETHFIGFYYDRTTNKNAGAFFTKRNPEDIPDKQVIVLAGEYIPYDLEVRVINYNKSSDRYRIVVKEYSSYNTMEDYNAGTTQLNNDIITGNMPDILIANNNLPIENYIAKGLIADIGKLIEKDEELSQIEYLQNVFDAHSVDGKLYYMVPSFYVQTFVAKTSMVGERKSWTMQEFQEFAKSLPEGTEAFSELTRAYFMNQVMQYCGNDFIDVSTGKCTFDSPEFISILEYAKTLPEELPEDYYGDNYWMSYESMYREDRAVLCQAYISNLRDMNRTINGTFGEPVTYIGFPTSTGDGAIITDDTSYVLSSKSKSIEGAWDFIRYYLTPEYQEELSWGLPVMKSAFDAKAKEALEKPFYLDENDEKVEYDDYFYINGEEIVLNPMTQEQLDQLIEVVTSASKRYYYNTDIQNIIDEEVAAFFEGQKSAQEVVQIIQSRAQIFVDENR